MWVLRGSVNVIFFDMFDIFSDALVTVVCFTRVKPISVCQLLMFFRFILEQVGTGGHSKMKKNNFFVGSRPDLHRKTRVCC